MDSQILMVIRKKQNEERVVNLLRRLRRKLINEGNLKRYIIYAIGEITLIIIGIILALQLNSWNYNRSIKAESQKLLGRLVEDVEGDLLYFEVQKSEYENWVHQIDLILNQVLDNDGMKISKWDQFAAGRMSLNFLQVNQITFTEMFNSGTTVKFKNDEIIRESFTIVTFWHICQI